MKHLKPYDESNYVVLPYNIIKELRDILLELTDEGFKVNIEGNENTYIEIYKPQFIQFRNQEILDVVYRIKDYMSGLGYGSIIQSQEWESKRILDYLNISFVCTKKSQNESRYENKILETKYYSNDDCVILPQEILDELHDICLELTDINYEVVFQHPNVEVDVVRAGVRPSELLSPILKISRKNIEQFHVYPTPINISENDDVIERIKDYMSCEGYDVKVKYIGNYFLYLYFVNI